MIPCGHYQGWDLPISTLERFFFFLYYYLLIFKRLCQGGIMPTATAKYEKRGLAVNVPIWDSGFHEILLIA
jgi:hypothetical protein